MSDDYDSKLELTKQLLKILSDYLKCLTNNDIPPDNKADLENVKKFINENLNSEQIDFAVILNFVPNMMGLITNIITSDSDPVKARKKQEKKNLALQSLENIKNNLNDLNNMKNNFKGISLNQYRKNTVDSPLEKTKSNIIGFVFILIFIGFIFLTAKYNNNVVAFLIFLFIISIPLIIIYRRQITKLLPIKLSDDIADTVSDAGKSVDHIGNSKGLKQILTIIIIIICQIVAVIVLRKHRKKFVGIMMALGFLIIAGVLTTELDKI